MFMAGCSKDNAQQTNPDAWVHDLSLPVPIQFGSPALLSKATTFNSLEDLAGHFMANSDDRLGVFGIAKNGVIDLDNDILLDNVKATVAIGSDGGYVVRLDDVKYYPRLSTQNFTFYGCYPRMTGRTFNESGSPVINVGSSDQNFSVKLGTTDILWAKAEATPFEYNGEPIDGYNAQYIRALRTSGNMQYSPKFHFEHVTAGLKFIAVGNDDGNNNTNDDFKGITINSVTVKQVCQVGKLDVMSGVITPDNSLPGNVTDITQSCKKAPTLEGTDLCQFFPCPQEGGYTVEVSVTSSANPQGYSITFNTGELQARKQYIYKLKFNKMDTVEIQVTGLDWTESEDFTVDTDTETPTPTPDNTTDESGDEGIDA